MEGEPLARPAEPALDLIHNQNSPALFCKFTSCAIEPFRNGTNTALTLNGFDQDGTDVISQLSLEVFLHPNLPMPSNLMNEQNMEKSALGALAMRTRIESGTPK